MSGFDVNLPRRIGVDAGGYVWREFERGFLSMAPSNPDNEPTPEPIAWYVPLADADTFVAMHKGDDSSGALIGALAALSYVQKEADRLVGELAAAQEALREIMGWIVTYVDCDCDDDSTCLFHRAKPIAEAAGGRVEQ